MEKSFELENLSQLRSFKSVDINGIKYDHIDTIKSIINTDSGQNFVELMIFLKEKFDAKYPDAILYSNESDDSLTFKHISYSQARFIPVKIKTIRVYP